MSRGAGVCACVCVGGTLSDLLPWPIKRGFAFDSVLKETDEPAELQAFLLLCQFSFPLLYPNSRLTRIAREQIREEDSLPFVASMFVSAPRVSEKVCCAVDSLA